jgi:hypothetical protein
MESMARPPPDPAAIVLGLLALPLVGRTIAPKSALACVVCHRRIGVMGRLLAPGWPACTEPGCEMVATRDVHALLAGRYGAALTRSNLGAWGTVLDVGGRTVVQKHALTTRRADLAARVHELVRWQDAFDAWERWRDLEGWRRGAVRHIPPRRVEDVAALRAYGVLVARSPIQGLGEPDEAQLQRFYDVGIEAAEASLGPP